MSIAVYQLDANILLRFLLNDHEEMALRAHALIQQANEGQIILQVSAVTVAELFYAMKAFYRIDRRKAARILADVLATAAFRLPEYACIMDALARVQAANVDFGDAYLAATAVQNGIAVASFDRDLDKFEDVRRYEL